MGHDDSVRQNESVEEFINRYIAVKELGWVRSHRSNNTGIGKTLEDLLMTLAFIYALTLDLSGS